MRLPLLPRILPHRYGTDPREPFRSASSFGFTEGTMSRQANGCMEHRGTVLVASDNRLFREIVGGMVADVGFVVEFLERTESTESSLARTRPELVICDCGGSEPGIRRLIAEVSARHLPLIMACSRGQDDEYQDDLTLP